MSAYICEDDHFIYLAAVYLKLVPPQGDFLEELCRVSNVLLESNVDSVNERYNDTHDLTLFTLKDISSYELPKSFEPAQVAQSAACYNYQTCESSDYRNCNEASKIIRRIETTYPSSTPGRDDTIWGSPSLKKQKTDDNSAVEQVDIFSIIENQPKQKAAPSVNASNSSIPTIKEMKSNITARLLSSLNVWKSYVVSKSHLETVCRGESFPNVYIRDIVESTVKYYFEMLCSTLTQIHSDNTPAEIILEESYFDFTARDSYRIKNPNVDRTKRVKINNKLLTYEYKTDDEIEELIIAVIESIPFETIAFSLNEQVKNIGSQGLQLISKNLLKGLNISTGYREPKSTARHVICQIKSKDDSSLEKSNEILQLAQALKRVENDTAISFGDALIQLANAVRELGTWSVIESRTHYCKGQALEVYCYLDKYEIRFTKNAFEAVGAFVYCYGSEDDINSLEKVMNEHLAA